MILSVLTNSSIVLFVFMTALFILALKIKNNSIADIAWGLGFIVITIVSLLTSNYYGPRQILVSSLTFIWGMRLAIHIYLRNRGQGEDFRYLAWRKQWGKAWVFKSYFYVFFLQGLLMLLVSLPVSMTIATQNPFVGPLERIGLAIWVLGFYFETVGDWQLMQFKKHKSNSGKILKDGLWKYTRHPNYFGEATMWWGIYLIAIGNISVWWTFVGPLFITFSLLKVSGISLLEKKYKGNKEYIEYQKRTPAFIPWFPKN